MIYIKEVKDFFPFTVEKVKLDDYKHRVATMTPRKRNKEYVKRLQSRSADGEPLRSPFADGRMIFEIVGNIHKNPELLEAKKK